MNLLTAFKNCKPKKVKLAFTQAGIEYVSSLGESEHEYIYSEILNFSEWFNDPLSATFSLLCKQGSSVSVAFFFFDSAQSKLDSKIFPSNQMISFCPPEGTVYFRVALRVYGPAEDLLIAMLTGDNDTVLALMTKYNSFNQSPLRPEKFTYSEIQPLIFLETLFCDTESNASAIQKYLSYFKGLLGLIAKQQYRNFIWLIHISSDKGRAIDEIRKIVERLNLNRNTVINIYDHPAGGYQNEHETHIDRLRRPNSSYPELREKIFDNALEAAGIDLGEIAPDQIVVRIAIDDDDFVSPHYFTKIAELAAQQAPELNDETPQAVIGINRVWITHLTPGGNSVVHDVKFSRMMTGCKFSVARGIIPLTPYAIYERFEAVQNSAVREIPHKIFSLDKPIFSYNRHGGNYSNQNKKSYYDEHIATHQFKDHQELLEFIENF
ncbi:MULTISPECIES: hypothetical protein [Pseudomonas]|uniref:hypothetical protein n=1 Tax=Pseudomonas TaxID=286 RepID=UPI000B6EAEDA|nr:MULTISPECIES: hypothetical protein [Pseudomonas]MBH3396262.1 hypothetical protein [Pseudomonas monteilii]SNT23634.1 hypothetical protein SAMN05660216_03193 [Pseudomonas sp. LAMO17WK12:I8]SNY27646.1 hypothetical protein SAMN05660893_03039 [Pseudomonas sp. LAMO17WK12:I12]SNY28021.1 hypothetical protein SAMN05660344_03119 [Pseudomonas sp. LAMO17WK12:I11]SNY28471.1 hypothetical protein SAMN05660700_03194 [Pseudomonas sp. LAMO17WK12:I7]